MSAGLHLFWQRYGLTALLAGGGVVLAGVIGFETGWGKAIRPAPAAASGATRSTDMVAVLPAYALPPLDVAFKETGERPLFSTSRRPSSAGQAAVPVMKKGQFKLTGTSVNADQSVAFLLETASGKTHWLRKGKEINGITLDSVEARRVVLKQGEETEELSLRTAPSPPAPRPTVAPAAAPGTQPAAPGQAAPTPPGMPAAVPPGFGSRSASDAGRYPAPLEAVPAAGTARVTAPATPADAAATAQRRRRFPNLPQQ